MYYSRVIWIILKMADAKGGLIRRNRPGMKAVVKIFFLS